MTQAWLHAKLLSEIHVIHKNRLFDKKLKKKLWLVVENENDFFFADVCAEN